MQENFQNKEVDSKQLQNSQQFQQNYTKIIILSLIFGFLGGFASLVIVNKVPQVKNLFLQNYSITGQPVSQKIVLTEDSAIIDVVKKASPAVVSIVISKDLNKVPGYGVNPFELDPFFQFFGNSQTPKSSAPNVQEIGAGSGFFVTDDGLILTNKHVVSDNQASYTVLTSDGKKYEAKILAQDSVNDLAIIKIDIKNAPFLTFTDSDKIQIGERVIAIGNSLGQYQNTVTAGIVSGIGRSITANGGSGSEQLSNVIQTDAAINPGNSGGPLLNVAGQVIGMNTAIDQQGQLVGFAIPANDVFKDLASFQKNGHIARPFLGVRYLMITAALAQDQKLPKTNGALILRGQNTTDFAVIPGSPADKAGLMENDIILEVNGTKVDNGNTLAALLKNYNVGDTVTLHIYHKGEEKDVKITLGEAK